MKVLITGITGFAGSHLLDYIVKNNLAEVYGIKRPRSPLHNIHSPAELIDCDITDSHSVESVIASVQPDRIFHLAAQSFVPLSWHAPRHSFETNVIGTLNVLEAVLRQAPGARVLFAGSSEEYGLVTPEECPITEDQPLRPLSPYGVTKVTGELLCHQYVRSYHMHVVTTRAFNHTGPRRGDVFVTSNFARQIALIEAKRADNVIHVGNLTAMRDFTDVRDMVQAYWLALEKCPPGEPFNICSGKVISIAGMLDALLNLSHIEITTKPDQHRMRPSDVELLHGSFLKFHALTKWQPTIPFRQTMEDLLDYWREEVANEQH